MIAELGPGDPLGIGLAGLITGAEKYYAFDVYEFADSKKNIQVLDELVRLFKQRTAIPGDKRFPRVIPKLDSYEFPGHILDDEYLDQALNTERIALIRDSVNNTDKGNSMINYVVPWYDPAIIQQETMDMIYSQAVLEHVDNLRSSYDALRLWLKPNGYMSHAIGLESHGTNKRWNGHWTYSDLTWRLLRGKRPYLLNRAPHSTHIDLLLERGFEIRCDLKVKAPSEIERNELAVRFKNLSEDDLTTSGVFIQSQIS